MVSAPMRITTRSTVLPIGAVLLALSGCGSSGGIPDSRFVGALNLTSAQGAYVMDNNPAFCSIARLLKSSSDVRDAAKSGGVVASSDGTVGIQVVTPFAPACRKEAQRGLDKLARKG